MEVEEGPEPGACFHSADGCKACKQRFSVLEQISYRSVLPFRDLGLDLLHISPLALEKPSVHRQPDYQVTIIPTPVPLRVLTFTRTRVGKTCLAKLSKGELLPSPPSPGV